MDNVIKLTRKDVDCVESVVPQDFEMELIFENVDLKGFSEKWKKQFSEYNNDF